MSGKQVTISLIHPSRGRGRQAAETSKKWMGRVGDGVDMEYFLCVDDDDRHNYDAFFPDEWVFPHKNRSAIDAINFGAKISTGDILIQIADDFDCPQDWGLKIIEATKGKTDWVLKTQDGIQKWIITLPIMDRAYYDSFGYVYHPDYLHMFSDLELSAVADLTGRRLTSEIMFKHNHYSAPGGAPKDAISERADKTWEQGKGVFLSRYRRNFDLVGMPGKITDQGYLNWVRNELNT